MLSTFTHVLYAVLECNDLHAWKWRVLRPMNTYSNPARSIAAARMCITYPFAYSEAAMWFPYLLGEVHKTNAFTTIIRGFILCSV